MPTIVWILQKFLDMVDTFIVAYNAHINGAYFTLDKVPKRR
jgi:hypothetical protein